MAKFVAIMGIALVAALAKGQEVSVRDVFMYRKPVGHAVVVRAIVPREGTALRYFHSICRSRLPNQYEQLSEVEAWSTADGIPIETTYRMTSAKDAFTVRALFGKVEIVIDRIGPDGTVQSSAHYPITETDHAWLADFDPTEFVPFANTAATFMVIDPISAGLTRARIVAKGIRPLRPGLSVNAFALESPGNDTSIYVSLDGKFVGSERRDGFAMWAVGVTKWDLDEARLLLPLAARDRTNLPGGG